MGGGVSVSGRRAKLGEGLELTSKKFRYSLYKSRGKRIQFLGITSRGNNRTARAQEFAGLKNIGRANKK